MFLPFKVYETQTKYHANTMSDSKVIQSKIILRSKNSDVIMDSLRLPT